MKKLAEFDHVDWEDFAIGIVAVVTFILSVSFFWLMFQS